MRHVWMGSACIGLTLLSGVGDIYGFVHASGAWRGGALVGSELGRSAAGFAVGIGSYWLVVRHLGTLGVRESTGCRVLASDGAALIQFRWGRPRSRPGRA